MSKSVRIPDYTTPSWSCSINGVKYSYPAGTVQEVPDAVASLIESLRGAYQKEEIIIPPFGGTFDPTIVCTATGCPISLKDSASHGLIGLKLYGKTTQNGKPSPDAPVALESVGADGRITVSIGAQTVSIATPNGLPGIPVTTGGNYTDATGQQWICDEVDFEKGVYVQRVYRKKFTNVDGIKRIESGLGYRFACAAPRLIRSDTTNGVFSLCNSLTLVRYGETFSVPNSYTVNDDEIMIALTGNEAIDDFADYLAEKPIEVQCVLVEPIQHGLKAREIEAYTALHTNYPNTVVDNDMGAYMEVKYVADTKLYIDEKFAAL